MVPGLGCHTHPQGESSNPRKRSLIMCIQAEYSTRTHCISFYMFCTMLVGQTFVLSWSRGGKAHRVGLLVGVVGTKTWTPCFVWGSAKGKRSRQGELSIITSLHVTTDCSAVSQLARLEPSTVSAVSVSAENERVFVGGRVSHIICHWAF